MGSEMCIRDRFNKESGHYSWWDYRTRGFERNDGMRIDHILASGDLLEQSTQSYIDLENRSKAKPSDHAPVFSFFKISDQKHDGFRLA